MFGHLQAGLATLLGIPVPQLQCCESALGNRLTALPGKDYVVFSTEYIIYIFIGQGFSIHLWKVSILYIFFFSKFKVIVHPQAAIDQFLSVADLIWDERIVQLLSAIQASRGVKRKKKYSLTSTSPSEVSCVKSLAFL